MLAASYIDLVNQAVIFYKKTVRRMFNWLTLLLIGRKGTLIAPAIFIEEAWVTACPICISIHLKITYFKYYLVDC